MKYIWAFLRLWLVTTWFLFSSIMTVVILFDQPAQRWPGMLCVVASLMAMLTGVVIWDDIKKERVNKKP